MLKKEDIDRFRFFLAYSRPYLQSFFILFFVDTLISLALISPPLILNVLIDYALPYQDFRMLVVLGSLALGLSASFQVLSGLREYLMVIVGQAVFSALSNDFYAKIHRLKLSYLKKNPAGELIYRLTQDLSSIQSMIMTFLPQLIGNAFRLLFIFFVCFRLNSAVTGLVLVMMPIMMWQTYFFSQRFKSYQHETQRVSESIFNMLSDRLGNIRLVKLFHQWRKELNLFFIQLNQFFETERKVKRLTVFQNFFSGFFNRSVLLSIALVLGYQTIKGDLSIGQAIAFVSYFPLLQKSIYVFFSMYTRFVTAQVSFSRVCSVLNEEEEPRFEEVSRLRSVSSGDIQFKKVTFSYDQTKKVLDGLSFQVKHGETVAIVGPSGIGKSSIIDLILGFYSPDSGEVLIDQNSIEKFSKSELRHAIGLIERESHLINGTVMENLTYGLDKEIPIQTIIQYAKQAAAHAFISSLSNGYDTPIGPGGRFLSSGQRQRITIAQSLLKNPKILIIDEGTSALDADSENQILNALKELHGQKTILLVAHRLTSVRHVDRVIVLGEQGRILEIGTPNELMEKQGEFYRLYTLQLGGFSQFMSQFEFLFKSAKAYSKPLVLAGIQVNNFKSISSILDNLEMDDFIEEFSTIVTLCLNKNVFSAYEKNGRIWVLFPDSDLNVIQMEMNRLTTYLSSIHFNTVPNKTLDFSSHCLNCVGAKSVKTILQTVTERLSYAT